MAVGIAVLLAAGCGGQAPEEEASQAFRPRADVSSAATAVTGHSLHTSRAGCTECHSPHGGMMGTALISLSTGFNVAGRPAASFDPVAKTCSNVSCHMVPAGDYTYWFPGGDGEPAQVTVSYGGVPVTTPPWNAALSGACRACHASPPVPSAGAWHSGRHGGSTSAALNGCALCHPDVVVSATGELSISTAMTCGPLRNESCLALHKNGVVDVAPRWKSTCFGCH